MPADPILPPATSGGAPQSPGSLLGSSGLIAPIAPGPVVPGVASPTAFALQADLALHTANNSNPHATTKAQVGLGNVDNTTDASKPVSLSTQTALNAKADKITPPILKIICIGDSMTSDAQSAQYAPLQTGQSWPSRLAEMMPATIVVNLGLSSRTVATKIANYTSLVAGHVPTTAQKHVCIIQAGYNDFLGGETTATVLSRLQTLCGLAKADGFHVVLWMVHTPDQAAYWLINKAQTEKLKSINEGILNNPQWYDQLYRYDLAFDLVSDRYQELFPFNIPRFFNDGLHPNTEASCRIARQIFEVLNYQPSTIVENSRHALLRTRVSRVTDFDKAHADREVFAPNVIAANDVLFHFDRYISKTAVALQSQGSSYASEYNARSFGGGNITTINSGGVASLRRTVDKKRQCMRLSDGGVSAVVFPTTSGAPWVFGFMGFGFSNAGILGATTFSPKLGFSTNKHQLNHAEGTVNSAQNYASNQAVAVVVKIDGATSSVWFYNGSVMEKIDFTTTSVVGTSINLASDNLGDAGKAHYFAALSCAASSITNTEIEKWMRNLNYYGIGTQSAT
jgi:lysophospholipase L1-like esterase